MDLANTLQEMRLLIAQLKQHSPMGQFRQGLVVVVIVMIPERK